MLFLLSGEFHQRLFEFLFQIMYDKLKFGILLFAFPKLLFKKIIFLFKVFLLGSFFIEMFNMLFIVLDFLFEPGHPFLKFLFLMLWLLLKFFQFLLLLLKKWFKIQSRSFRLFFQLFILFLKFHHCDIKIGTVGWFVHLN